MKFKYTIINQILDYLTKTDKHLRPKELYDFLGTNPSSTRSALSREYRKGQENKKIQRIDKDLKTHEYFLVAEWFRKYVSVIGYCEGSTAHHGKKLYFFGYTFEVNEDSREFEINTEIRKKNKKCHMKVDEEEYGYGQDSALTIEKEWIFPKINVEDGTRTNKHE